MAAAPTIFSTRRRTAARARADGLSQQLGAARYLLEDMVEDVCERLAFLRHAPSRALIVGDRTHALAALLADRDCEVFERDPAGHEPLDEERPYPENGFELVASLGTLDTVNDLPGALIHLRHALAPGGLMIASFCGAGSLPTLRAAMLAADGERPAPRLHPQVDVRAGGQLLQRCGFFDPVIDTRTLTVRFASLDSLVADLRAQALTNVLERPGPPLGKSALDRARVAFAAAGTGGRTTERFEILTLSGWRR